MVSPVGAGPAGRTTYTYDACGNRTQKETPDVTTYYAWDEDNRLIAAEPPAGAVTLTYNADGQRVRKTAPTDDKKFLYDFQKLLAETDAADQTEMLYTATTEEYGDLVSRYDESAGASGFYQYDAQGSADALLDDAQSVTDRLAYRAFGAIESHSPSAGDVPQCYVGRQGYYRDRLPRRSLHTPITSGICNSPPVRVTRLAY